MTQPESPLSQPETLPETITDSLIRLDAQYHLGYDEEGLAELLEQARAGQEVVVPLVADSIWTPKYTAEDEALRWSLDGGWAYSFEEWLWEHGQRFTGTPAEELRDPVTGRIADPDFIATLTQTGKAVELTRRQDEARGEIVVNNVWSLWRTVGPMDLWPFVTVDTVDADIGETSHWEQSRPQGPAFLRVPHPVAVGRRLVILPGLVLPRV